MPEDTVPPGPDRLARGHGETGTVELLGRQIWYHDQGPKTDDAVLIVHGYPGSSWGFQGVIERIGGRLAALLRRAPSLLASHPYGLRRTRGKSVAALSPARWLTMVGFSA